MKKLLVLLFVVVSTIMFLVSPCFAVDGKITLTEDEIIFVNEHPVIRLGVDPAFVPLTKTEDTRVLLRTFCRLSAIEQVSDLRLFRG